MDNPEKLGTQDKEDKEHNTKYQNLKRLITQTP